MLPWMMQPWVTSLSINLQNNFTVDEAKELSASCRQMKSQLIENAFNVSMAVHILCFLLCNISDAKKICLTWMGTR